MLLIKCKIAYYAFVPVCIWWEGVCETCYGLVTGPGCIPCLCSLWAGDRLYQSPATLLRYKAGVMMDGWMHQGFGVDSHYHQTLCFYVFIKCTGVIWAVQTSHAPMGATADEEPPWCRPFIRSLGSAAGLTAAPAPHLISSVILLLHAGYWAL